MLKTYEIPLDLEKVLYTPSTLLFNVSRNDFDSVQLIFQIKQDDLPIDLTNKTVELAVKKPSGLTVYQQAEITNAIQGEAKILLSIQAYVEYGVHTAEIYIRDGENLAVTSPFYYASRAAIMESDIESVNDWTALHYALFAFDLKPIITDGFPTDTPQYVGQMAFDALYKKTYVATDLSATAWEPIGTGEGGGGGLAVDLGAAPPEITPRQIGAIFIDTLEPAGYIALGASAGDWKRIDNKKEEGTLTNITWADILDKPLTFAPELHNHTIAEITGLQTELNNLEDATNKPLEPHTHGINDIENLAVILDTKSDITHNHDTLYSPINHGHEINEITGLQAALDSKSDVGAGGTLEPHTHEINDITGLRTELDTKATTADVIADFTELNNTKANITDVYTKLETYNKGEVDNIVTGITQGGGTIVEDNLVSISPVNALSANQGRVLNEKIDTKQDAGTIPAHNHTTDEITGLIVALDSKADINHNHDLVYSPINHTHETAEIVGLQAALDTKQDAGTVPAHVHTWEEITGKPLLFTPDAHVHTIGEITGLQGALDGKQDAGTIAEHTHTTAEITGLDAQLTAINTELDTKADINHNHDLVYSPINHNHDAEYSDINHNHDLVYSPITHNHAITEITGLQAELDAINTELDNHTHDDLAPSNHTHQEIITLENQLNGLSLWQGTQAEYDNLVKDASTLYFISG